MQRCMVQCSKHADSTVLVMELLGESMSMLRVSPDAIHGVPVSKCVSVGIEASVVCSAGDGWYKLGGVNLALVDAGLH